MTITFENDNDVIIYALEKVISYARRTQQIFVAQCIWWLASIIELDQELVNYIDNLQSRLNVTIIPDKGPSGKRTISPAPRDNQEDQRRDQVIKECEEFLRDSKKQREVSNLQESGKTQTGRINPLKATKDSLRVSKQRKVRGQQPSGRQEHKCSGIGEAEIQRKTATGECLRCAWPINRTGTHQVRDCRRPIKVSKGTASFPEAKEYQKLAELSRQQELEDNLDQESSSDSSNYEWSL
jgi:hypothetical protein